MARNRLTGDHKHLSVLLINANTTCLHFVTLFIHSDQGCNRNHAMRKNTHFFLMNESSHH